MTAQELDGLGFRALEDKNDDDYGTRWDWGSYTHEGSHGSLSYFPILQYNINSKKVWISPFEDVLYVDKFDTMLEVINSVSFLMSQRP